MGPEHLPFIVYSDDDVSPDAPRILLELQARGELSLTLPYRVTFNLRRAPSDTTKPYIFRWSPYRIFANAEMVLLHITPRGAVRIPIEPRTSPARDDEDTIPSFNGWTPRLEEMPARGDLALSTALPMRYQTQLQAGETYQLLWPGGEVGMWDWGSRVEHVGKEVKSQRTRLEQPKLVIPAAEPVTFTAREEEEPWPERPEVIDEFYFNQVNNDEWRWRVDRDPAPSPPPLGPLDRVTGAPMLSLEIDCPREWTKDAPIELKTKVTYADLMGDDIRPFTFHTSAFVSTFSGQNRRAGRRLYQRLEGGWKEVVDEFLCCGFGIFDDPPIPVNVGDEGKYSDLFVTLRPGEAWEYVSNVQGEHWTSLPDDVKVGDEFKYVIKGAVVDWWDWGTKEDHRETAVKLPCFIKGDLEEPRDNGGRPQLVVPASNEVYFSYVG